MCACAYVASIRLCRRDEYAIVRSAGLSVHIIYRTDDLHFSHIDVLFMGIMCNRTWL